jgi:copper(I)-binding protein
MIKMRTILKWSLVVCLALNGAFTFAADREQGLVIDDVWVRGLLPGRNMTAGFLSLNNQSSQDEILVGVEAEGVDSIEIHGHFHEGGLMKMRQVDSLLVKAGSTQVLAPGSYHLMMFGVKAGLKLGSFLPLTLSFESGLQVQVDAKVISVLQE